MPNLPEQDNRLSKCDRRHETEKDVSVVVAPTGSRSLGSECIQSQPLSLSLSLIRRVHMCLIFMSLHE